MAEKTVAGDDEKTTAAGSMYVHFDIDIESADLPQWNRFQPETFAADLLYYVLRSTIGNQQHVLSKI
jgi:hypothetical protein